MSPDRELITHCRSLMVNIHTTGMPNVVSVSQFPCQSTNKETRAIYQQKSRARKRIGEWLHEIVHVNSFAHPAEKNVNYMRALIVCNYIGHRSHNKVKAPAAVCSCKFSGTCNTGRPNNQSYQNRSPFFWTKCTVTWLSRSPMQSDVNNRFSDFKSQQY